MAGGAGIWGELIKQGFQNFRTGLNNLNSGFGNIAMAANTGKQQFNPASNNNNGYVPAQTGGNGIFAQGLSNVGNTINDYVNNRENKASKLGTWGAAADDEINDENTASGFGIFGDEANSQIVGNGLYDKLLNGGGFGW